MQHGQTSKKLILESLYTKNNLGRVASLNKNPYFKSN